MSVPAEWGRSISVTNRDIGPVSPTSMACKSFEASTEYPLDRSTAPMPCKLVGSSSKMLPNRQPQNGIGTGDGRRRGSLICQRAVHVAAPQSASFFDMTSISSCESRPPFSLSGGTMTIAYCVRCGGTSFNTFDSIPCLQHEIRRTSIP